MMDIDTTLLSLLQNALAKTDLNVSEIQQKQLVAYVQLMDKWNKAYNLTSLDVSLVFYMSFPVHRREKNSQPTIRVFSSPPFALCLVTLIHLAPD